MENKDFILALEQLERERNIKKDDVILTIQDALVSALRKHIGKSAEIFAKVDTETGEMSAYQKLIAVEIVTNEETEISLDEAKEIDKNVKAGDVVERILSIDEFSRIASQIAKQILIQKVRDIEREALYKEYKPREGEIVNGTLRRFSDRDIVVDLGHIEAILPYSEQIHRERYTSNSRIRAMIVKVITHKDLHEDPSNIKYKQPISRMDKTQRGPFVILTRANPDYLKKLFEIEVPEIADRIIELVKIEREPGFRAKVVVRSNDSKVDPIGACVGMRGMRIRSVMNELSGERIDLIPYTIDDVQMIKNAMSPATVDRIVVTDKENKRATVIVPDDQLAIAIGRDWQNINLASRITGWHLEAKSQKEVSDAATAKNDEETNKLLEIEGITPKIANILTKAELTDLNKIAALTPEHLTAYQGIGEKTAEKIIESVKAHLEVTNNDSKENN